MSNPMPIMIFNRIFSGNRYSSDDQTLKNSPEGKHCIGVPSITGEKDEEQESNFDHVAEVSDVCMY